VEVVGLDPYQGFYHAEKYGRPALALDLLEEFRGPVADSVALTLINKRMLGPEDFVVAAAEPPGSPDEPAGRAGVYLKRDPLKVYLREFTERLESTFTHPLAGRPMTYRKCLELQARQAAKTITGEIPRYTPLRVR
jgi:CRISP-associated protein Cas1